MCVQRISCLMAWQGNLILCLLVIKALRNFVTWSVGASVVGPATQTVVRSVRRANTKLPWGRMSVIGVLSTPIQQQAPHCCLSALASRGITR